MLAETVTPWTQAITFTIVAAFVTLMTIVLGNRNRAQTAKQLNDQHDRDETARRAEKAQDNLLAIAKEQRDYARADLIQRRTDHTAQRTLRKLGSVERLGKVTHSLVNSDKTAAMREKLDSKETELILLKEVIELKRANGLEPTDDTVRLLSNKQQTIDTLVKDIEERVTEQKVAEAANIEADRAAAAADEADDEADDLLIADEADADLLANTEPQETPA